MICEPLWRCSHPARGICGLCFEDRIRLIVGEKKALQARIEKLVDVDALIPRPRIADHDAEAAVLGALVTGAIALADVAALDLEHLDLPIHRSLLPAIVAACMASKSRRAGVSVDEALRAWSARGFPTIERPRVRLIVGPVFARELIAQLARAAPKKRADARAALATVIALACDREDAERLRQRAIDAVLFALPEIARASLQAERDRQLVDLAFASEAWRADPAIMLGVGATVDALRAHENPRKDRRTTWLPSTEKAA